jgi:hypothetical protein
MGKNKASRWGRAGEEAREEINLDYLNRRPFSRFRNSGNVVNDAWSVNRHTKEIRWRYD